MLDSAAIAAAQAIDAHEMIVRLPQGYDTPIGLGGVGLSAGQTQRIALARALFGNPAILLLDEPTAHLDAEAQQAFIVTLNRLRECGTTVLFASHNVETLASADKLLVMASGRVENLASNNDLRPADLSPAVSPTSFRTRKVFR
jgi:ATP-binding cassette subfamily C protein